VEGQPALDTVLLIPAESGPARHYKSEEQPNETAAYRNEAKWHKSHWEASMGRVDHGHTPCMRGFGKNSQVPPCATSRLPHLE